MSSALSADTGMQRFRSQGSSSNIAVPARRLNMSLPSGAVKLASSPPSAPPVRSTALSSSPAPRRGANAVRTPLQGRDLQSAPCRRPPPAGGRQAQQDLTQKLRAMDLELERIECENVDSKCHVSTCPEEAHSNVRKENHDPTVPMVVMPASEAQQMREDLARAAMREAEYQKCQAMQHRSPVGSTSGSNSNVADRIPVLRSSSLPPERAIVPTAFGSGEIFEDSTFTEIPEFPQQAQLQNQPQQQLQQYQPQLHGAEEIGFRVGNAREKQQLLQALEANFTEEHAVLRAELTQELANLHECREEDERSTVRLITEFEVQLTAALEARAKEADMLLEKKLIEAGDGMQRRISASEDSVNEDRSRLTNLEGDTKKRLAELEAAMQISLEGDTKQRLIEVENAMQGIHAEKLKVAEQVQTCGEALQPLKDQLATVRQRLAQLQDEGTDTKDQLASFRLRVQQLHEDREDSREQLGSLRQRMSNLAAESACGSSHLAEAAETRRLCMEFDGRLSRLDESLGMQLRDSEVRVRTSASEDLAALRQQVQPLLDASAIAPASEALGNRICELESCSLAQHKVLEGQLHELQRNMSNTENHLHGELRALDMRVSAGRFEERLNELRRSCELEVAALRERLDGAELRCAEETRELLCQGLDEAEARSLGVTEGNITAQLDGLRAEFRAELRVADQPRDHNGLDLSGMERQLAQSDEERRLLSEQLDTLVDRQRRQQYLLEDLLSAAARRPSCVDEAGRSAAAGPSPAPSSELTDEIVRRFEAFTLRLASIEESRATFIGQAVQSVADQSVADAASRSLVSRIIALEEHRATFIGQADTRDDSEHCSGKLHLFSARLTSVEDQVVIAGAAAMSLPARIAALEEHRASSSQQSGSDAQVALSDTLAGQVDHCSGKLDLLAARLTSVEDQAAAVAGLASASVAEAQQVLLALSPNVDTMVARVDKMESGSAELRTDLLKELNACLEKVEEKVEKERTFHHAELGGYRIGLQRVEEEGARRHAEIEALMTRRAEGTELERKAFAEQLAAHAARTDGAEKAAAAAERVATQLAEEAKSLRQLADKAEESYVNSSAAMEHAVNCNWPPRKVVEDVAEDGKGVVALARLEAHVEVVEKRHSCAISELSMRLDEELKRNLALRDVEAEEFLRKEQVAVEAGPSEANSSHVGHFSAEEAAPWLGPLRSLECQLKGLMAAQAEDSAAALRSMAMFVGDSVLRADTVSMMRGQPPPIASRPVSRPVSRTASPRHADTSVLG